MSKKPRGALTAEQKAEVLETAIGEADEIASTIRELYVRLDKESGE